MSTVGGPDIVEDGLVLCLDAANKRCYSPNLHPRPTDVATWSEEFGPSLRGIVTQDNIESPVGNTPLKVVPTDNVSGGNLNTYNNPNYNLAEAVQGDTWTFSFYLKANTYTSTSAFIFEANSSGSQIGFGTEQFLITPEWQRFELTHTFINPLAAYVQVRVDWYPDTSLIFWYDGFQVEKASAATNFNPNYFDNTVNDLSGNQNNGVSPNILEFDSANNGSIVFDGLSNFVDLGNLDTWNNFGNSLTIDCVFSFAAPNEAFARLVSKFFNGSSTANSCFQLTTNSNSTSIRWSINGIEDSVPVSREQIYHVTGWYDGTNSKMYLNGELQFTLNVSGDIRTSSFPLSVGAGLNSSVSAKEYYTGNIFLVRIYNRALTEQEIEQNFKALQGRYGL